MRRGEVVGEHLFGVAVVGCDKKDVAVRLAGLVDGTDGGIYKTVPKNRSRI